MFHVSRKAIDIFLSKLSKATLSRLAFRFSQKLSTSRRLAERLFSWMNLHYIVYYILKLLYIYTSNTFTCDAGGQRVLNCKYVAAHFLHSV